MSIATRFKYYRPFPFCLASGSPGAFFDFVDVPLADAMALWWNLEELSFDTDGSYLTRNGDTVDIDWDTVLNPESLPFITTSTNSYGGSYYNGTTPAQSPVARVCSSDSRPIQFQFLRRTFTATREFVKIITLDIRLRAAPSASDVRVYYQFGFSSASYVFPHPPGLPFRVGGIVSVANTANSFGSPPASGTISLLGLSLGWIGGATDSDGTTFGWDGDAGVDISASSSAFTY